MKSIPKGVKLAYTRIATKAQSDIVDNPSDPGLSALFYALPKLLLSRMLKNHPENKGSKKNRKTAQVKYQAHEQTNSTGKPYPRRKFWSRDFNFPPFSIIHHSPFFSILK